MEKQYCPYCGSHKSDRCQCEREAAEETAEMIEALEERQHQTGFYAFQDMMDAWRFER